jgi:hypothetical protein
MVLSISFLALKVLGWMGWMVAKPPYERCDTVERYVGTVKSKRSKFWIGCVGWLLSPHMRDAAQSNVTLKRSGASDPIYSRHICEGLQHSCQKGTPHEDNMKSLCLLRDYSVTFHDIRILVLSNTLQDFNIPVPSITLQSNQKTTPLCLIFIPGLPQISVCGNSPAYTMLSILLSLPFLIALAVAQETITAIGDGDAATISNIYNALGGTFNLSGTGIPGFEEAYVSHVGFGDDFSDYLKALKLNSTWQTVSTNSTATYSGLTKRYAIRVDSTTCAGSASGDQLLSTQIQTFIAGPACTFIVKAHPYIYAVLGALISGVACGPHGAYRCTVPIAIIAAAPGVYIGPGIQANCKATLAAITDQCGTRGGSNEVTVTPTGSQFDATFYATTETATGPCRGTNSKCGTYACHDGCRGLG